MLTAFLVFLLILHFVERSRRERIVNSSIDVVVSFWKKRIVVNTIFIILCVILFIRGNHVIAKGRLFDPLFGFLDKAVAVIVGVIYIIRLIASIGELSTYSNMNETEYRQHQIATKQQIDKDDKDTVAYAKASRRINSMNNFFGNF